MQKYEFNQQKYVGLINNNNENTIKRPNFQCCSIISDTLTITCLHTQISANSRISILFHRIIPCYTKGSLCMRKTWTRCSKEIQKQKRKSFPVRSPIILFSYYARMYMTGALLLINIVDSRLYFLWVPVYITHIKN